MSSNLLCALTGPIQRQKVNNRQVLQDSGMKQCSFKRNVTSPAYGDCIGESVVKVELSGSRLSLSPSLQA
jgi:hypothetical protein